MTHVVDQLLEKSPFSLAKDTKSKLYEDELQKLTGHHYEQCPSYRKILDLEQFDVTSNHAVASLPFLPVRLFKMYDLKSVPAEQIVSTLVSSGTSGQQVSRINLDSQTSIHQKKVLIAIVSDFIGGTRLPMLVIDSKAVLRNRELFSARGAGIMGFSLLGKNMTYALDEHMNLDLDAIHKFADLYSGQKVLLFGFTYMIWKHFVQALQARSIKIDLNQGILIHGGGWKKLQTEAVDNQQFKEAIHQASGVKYVHQYYGMVEQTGSIFMECESGRLHCSNYSDILIRDANFELCEIGKSGLIELMSLVPHSYPGHIILTEDQGRLTGEDDCPCGRKGKTFEVLGRIKQAEIRGCSDTYSA